MLITSIPARNIATEASTIIGYPFQESSKVTVNVDGQVFMMFANADAAWIEVPANEPALIDAMRRGSTMTVEGRSRRGTVTMDTYSLRGVTAALEAMLAKRPMVVAYRIAHLTYFLVKGLRMMENWVKELA